MMNSFFKIAARLWWRGSTGILCGLVCSCVVLGKRDAFPVASLAPAPALLQTLDREGSDVRPLTVRVGGHCVAAYYMLHTGAKGVLIFFGGSGNQVDAALKVLGPRTASLGLDLVAWSYYQQGEDIPSITQVRAAARAVYAAARTMHPPASKSIYLCGHSLGGWFALDVAANESVRGLVLAGAETTPMEVIRKTDAPWASLVFIRPDHDARQLDASLYTPRVQARTLIVTSRQDEAVPASVGQEIFQMLPARVPKKFVVLDRAMHGGYFLSDEFWNQFADFFGLRKNRP